jgi:hypothetical protein
LASGQSSPEKPISQSSHDQFSSPFLTDPPRSKGRTGRNGRSEVVSSRYPTHDQGKGGWRRDRPGKREDNTNGKWNYEVVVKTNGKEWGIEVDPNGKFLRQQSAIKK